VFIAAAGVPVVAAQVSAAAGSPFEPGQANESVVSFVWAYGSAAFLQWWKRSKMGGFSENMLRHGKTAVGLAMAFAGALGVHGSFDASQGTLTITGLLWPGLWTAVGDTIRQFAFQQFAYRTAIEPKGQS
jgi:hypothetical protein